MKSCEAEHVPQNKSFRNLHRGCCKTAHVYVETTEKCANLGTAQGLMPKSRHFSESYPFCPSISLPLHHSYLIVYITYVLLQTSDHFFPSPPMNVNFLLSWILKVLYFKHTNLRIGWLKSMWWSFLRFWDDFILFLFGGYFVDMCYIQLIYGVF